MKHRGLTFHPARKIKSTHQKTSPKEKIQEIHQRMDAIAKTTRTSSPHLPHIPMPMERIHLIDNDGEITGNEKTILETNWPSYSLENYYMNRWQITHTELQENDWSTYEKLYKKSSPQLQKFMVKLLTGWLPVYHHVNKTTMEQTMCPWCKNDETIPHMFQCTHRASWRTQFQHKLQQTLSTKNTSTEMQHLIYQHIHNLLTNPTQYSHFHHFKIFSGLLPRSWFRPPHKQNNDRTTQNKMMKLSKWFVNQGHELWLLRNQQVQATSDTTPNQKRLNQKIAHLYKLQEELPIHDRVLFDTPLEERLELTEKQKITWIDETTATVRVSIAEHKQKMSTGQTDIRQFFQQSGSSS